MQTISGQDEPARAQPLAQPYTPDLPDGSPAATRATPAMRDLAQNVVYSLYRYSGAMRAQETLAYWAGRRAAAVLLFHRVTDAIPPDGLTVGTRFFRELCGLLRDRFHVVPVAEVFRLLKEGRSPPRRTVAITFDDCYYDNLEAARVLAEHGLPACFFIPTRYVGTDHVFEWDRDLPKMPNLDWDDVRAIAGLGHEIGSHTVSHADLGMIGVEETRYELAESRKALEMQLGRPVRWFAYPYGGRDNFRPEYLPLVYEAGYAGCFSACGGFVRPGMDGQILPREAVPYFRSARKLELHLAGCLDWVYALKRRAGLIPASAWRSL